MNMNKKKKIHVVHSTKIENWKKIYKILRETNFLRNQEIFLPHETKEVSNTKTMIKEADLIVAECTEITPGIAIELAWADAFAKDVIIFVKEDVEVNQYLKFFNFEIIRYFNESEIVKYLEKVK